MKLTTELAKFLKVDTSRVHSPYNLATPFNSNNGKTTEVQWANPDEQFTVELNFKTNEITGSYYDWDEEADDWVTTDEMTDEDLLSRIQKKQFVLQGYRFNR